MLLCRGNTLDKIILDLRIVKDSYELQLDAKGSRYYRRSF